MNDSTYPIVCEPQFIEATRDTGYRSTASAIAELVDNSIQAGSTQVQIWVFEERQGEVREITVAVLDNGKGMESQVMRIALQFGGSPRFNDRGSLGRFGMGLPNSSVSQCRRVEVYSWQSSQTIYHTYLDIDEITSGELKQIPEPQRRSLPVWVNSFSRHSGTLVIWQKCDRLDYLKVDTVVRKLHAPLGRKFRYFLFEGVRIEVNGEPVKPIDPLYCHKESVLDGGEEYNLPLEYAVKVPKNPAQTSVIQVRFVRLPVLEWFDWPTEQKRYYGIVGGGGVSIVRARREIAYGWYFMGKKRRQNYDDWWRCEIRFEPELDELFGVNHSKQDITPTTELHEILSSDIESIASRLNVLTRDDFIQAKSQKKPKSVITAESRERLLPPPSPVKMGEHKIFKPNGTLPGAPMLRYDVQTRPILEPEFFTWKFESNVLQVNINENHPFYTKLYQPLKNGDTFRTLHDLECLLLSYVRSEITLTPEDNLNNLAEFRIKWSHILAALLT